VNAAVLLARRCSLEILPVFDTALHGAEEAALVGGLRGDTFLAALVDGAVDFTSLLAEAGDAVEGSPLAQPRVPDIPRRISFGREGARLTRTGTLSEKCH